MLRMMGRNLAVRRDVKNEQTSGGIIIPEAALDKSPEAIVIALGSDLLLSGVNEGDKVIIAPYAGMDVDVDGDKLIILDISDVLAVKEASNAQ